MTKTMAGEVSSGEVNDEYTQYRQQLRYAGVDWKCCGL